MSFQQHKIVMKQHCLDRSGQGRLPGTGNGCRQRKDEQEVKGIEEETGRGRPCKKKIKRPWESRARGAGHGCRRGEGRARREGDRTQGADASHTSISIKHMSALIFEMWLLYISLSNNGISKTI